MKPAAQVLPIVPLTVLLSALPAANAGQQDEEEEDAIPFEEARLFFELNHTDGDLGLQGLIDGDEWKRLEIEGPREALLLDVVVRGKLRHQGLTEIFFESAEPTFDELPPPKFFKRFPAGIYEISGITLGGEELESTAVLSHVMPAPPGSITISAVPSAPNCDAEPLPVVSEPVVIDWAEVTQSHPSVGAAGAIEVAGYQFVLEREEPELLVLSVDLPPTVTEFEIPSGFIALGDAFKFEIVARATNGNQTVVESCFEIE
jgi:hypothetical protein